MGLFNLSDYEKEAAARDAVKHIPEKIAPKDGKVHALAFSYHWRCDATINMQIAEEATNEFERILAAIQSYDREIIDVSISKNKNSNGCESSSQIVVLYR